jgi:hypothetical protein
MVDLRRSSMRGFSPGLALVVVVGATCSSESEPDLPEGWSGAAPVSLVQSTCPSGFAPIRGNPRLEVTKSDDGLQGIYRDATFRCGDQKVCGYMTEVGESARVLIQPCDMHPTNATRCTCHYVVTFMLPARAGRTTLELYRRSDLSDSPSPLAAALIDTERVP